MRLIDKIMHGSITAITDAWDFKRNPFVHIASILGLAMTGFIEVGVCLSKNFLGISGTLLIMICLIVTMDFVTGILAAAKKGRIICAAKGIRSAYKLGTYLVFLFCTHTLVKEYSEYVIVASTIKAVHIYITIHIFFWESFSVDENLNKLGVNLGLVRFLRTVLDSIQKKAIDNLPKIPTDDKEN